MPVSRPLCLWLLCLVVMLASGVACADSSPSLQAPFAVDDAQLQADYWIARSDTANAPRMPGTQIAAFNARLLRDDASMHGLARLPATLTAAQVRAWIQTLSSTPRRTLYSTDGQTLTAAQLDALRQSLALGALPARITPAYALVVQRAALRTFPTTQRVFTTPDDRDIDRFQ